MGAGGGRADAPVGAAAVVAAAVVVLAAACRVPASRQVTLAASTLVTEARAPHGQSSVAHH